MSAHKLTRWIGRLEQLEGPDRDLDAHIHYEVHQGPPVFDANCRVMDHVPAYTASIDAALLLVPNGLNYVLRSLQGNAEARVGGWKDEFRIKEGHHPLPAIALCLAALRARRTQINPGQGPTG